MLSWKLWLTKLAAELEASYPPERVRVLMANGGFEP